MKKGTFLLTLLLLTGLALFILHHISRDMFSASRPDSTETEDALFESLTGPDWFKRQPLPVGTALQSPRHPSVHTQPFYRYLESRAGSYTNLSDLFTGREGGGAELSSRWIIPYLFPEKELPSIRFRFSQNPQTGEYELSGGTLAIPQTGLEAGYETIPETEDYKATLQFKKSF